MTLTNRQGEAEVIVDTLKYSFCCMFQKLCIVKLRKFFHLPLCFVKTLNGYVCSLLVYVCTIYSVFKKYKVTKF